MLMHNALRIEGSPRPWVGVKPPPVGRVGGCPAYQPGGTFAIAGWMQ